MQVMNCKNCGRLFNYISGQKVCPVCREELEKKFQVAKDYIRSTPHATVAMVAEECDIPESQVKQWVKEERLVFADASIAGIGCEVCGSPIATGRFCDKCKAQMMNDLGGAVKKPEVPKPVIKQKDSPRMRFLDNR